MSKDVMAGYKLTEVGVIPDDWEVKPLKRLSPSQSVGLVINPSSYFDWTLEKVEAKNGLNSTLREE